MVTQITHLDQEPTSRPGDEVVAIYKEFCELPSIEILEAESPAIPSEILLGSVRDGRLRVTSPIKVRFTSEDPHIIAEAVDFDEFGFGENYSEALVDLQHTIAELFFTLEEEQGHLGHDLQNVWASLQGHIREQ